MAVGTLKMDATNSKHWWSSREIRDVINRCHMQIETMIANHERPEKIEMAQDLVKKMHKWLLEVEQEEMIAKFEAENAAKSAREAEARERQQAGAV